MSGYIERDEYSERAKLVGNELDSALASLEDELHDCVNTGDAHGASDTFQAICGIHGVLTVFDTVAAHIVDAPE